MDIPDHLASLDIPIGPGRNAAWIPAQSGVVRVQESDAVKPNPNSGSADDPTELHLAPVSLKELRLKHRLRAEAGQADHPLFQFYTQPATYTEFSRVEDFEAAANEYFERCFLTGTQPRLNGLALALGCPGPASLQRLAMRQPALRRIVSRCLTAVANGYESADGNSAMSIFMLKHIPEFDVQEPAGSAPIQYFNDRQEVNVYTRVAGVIDHTVQGTHLSPQEAYYRLIHQRDSLPEDIADAEIVEAKPDSLEAILNEETLFEDDA